MVNQNIRFIGQSKQLEPIFARTITAQGHHRFCEAIKAQEATIVGSCIIDGVVQMKKLKSGGHLTMNRAKLEELIVTGTLSAKHIQTKDIFVRGKIRVDHLEAEYGEIIMKCTCHIGKMNVEKLIIKKGFSFSSRLVSESITGKYIQLTHTQANTVRGEHVVLGENCEINTLYYTEQYTIAKSSSAIRIVKEVL